MAKLQRPQPKKELAVLQIIHSTMSGIRVICFSATQEAAKDVEEFGRVRPGSNKDAYLYRLDVDPRYDFEEVVAYLQNYDDDGDLPDFLQEGEEE